MLGKHVLLGGKERILAPFKLCQLMRHEVMLGFEAEVEQSNGLRNPTWSLLPSLFGWAARAQPSSPASCSQALQGLATASTKRYPCALAPSALGESHLCPEAAMGVRALRKARRQES